MYMVYLYLSVFWIMCIIQNILYFIIMHAFSHIASYGTALYHIVLYCVKCILLYCILLHCIVLYCIGIVLYCIGADIYPGGGRAKPGFCLNLLDPGDTTTPQRLRHYFAIFLQIGHPRQCTKMTLSKSKS